MMLGLGSVEIAAAFWLCIGASILCLVYGILNWNNKGYVPPAKVVKPREDA